MNSPSSRVIGLNSQLRVHLSAITLVPIPPLIFPICNVEYDGEKIVFFGFIFFN